MVYRLAAAALCVALWPSIQVAAQTCGATQPVDTAALTGCSVPCTCRFRITWTEEHTPTVTDPTGTPSASLTTESGQRSQGAEGGKPHSVITCKGRWDSVNNVPVDQVVNGASSSGWLRIRIEHIDRCPECATNCAWSGWSQPMVTLTASTEGTANYGIQTRLQAIFALLTGANNDLAVNESASSGTYVGSITGGVAVGTSGPSVSGSAQIVGSTTTSSAPNGRLYATNWKKDNKVGLEETLILYGSVTSQARAAGTPAISSANQVQVKLDGAMHCAGVQFKCVCQAGTHPPASGGSDPTPGNAAPGGGGTTPGPYGPNGQPIPPGPDGTTTPGPEGGGVTSEPLPPSSGGGHE